MKDKRYTVADDLWGYVDEVGVIAIVIKRQNSNYFKMKRTLSLLLAREMQV